MAHVLQSKEIFSKKLFTIQKIQLFNQLFPCKELQQQFIYNNFQKNVPNLVLKYMPRTIYSLKALFQYIII